MERSLPEQNRNQPYDKEQDKVDASGYVTELIELTEKRRKEAGHDKAENKKGEKPGVFERIESGDHARRREYFLKLRVDIQAGRRAGAIEEEAAYQNDILSQPDEKDHKKGMKNLIETVNSDTDRHPQSQSDRIMFDE